MNIINQNNKVKAELGDVILNVNLGRYHLLISQNGHYSLLFLDSFTTSTLNYKTIDKLMDDYFNDDNIRIYKKDNMDLILK